MAPRQKILPSSNVPFPESFATGHILSHRVIGSEALIKIVAYRDQLYVQYENMPADAKVPIDDPLISEENFGPSRFLARHRLTSIVMSLEVAEELAAGLRKAIERGMAGDYIDEE